MTDQFGRCARIRSAAILTAEGQAKAIRTVFNAIHEANPSQKVLAYQYLQALPQIANGTANKVWIVPTELTRALERARCRRPPPWAAPTTTARASPNAPSVT